ncbi:MAG: ABC transporter ATP-binding protein [Elusimicrobia bacterium]|nr:ABC transporter ATP-binding protein [Elusimicrobiota bacterium]
MESAIRGLLGVGAAELRLLSDAFKRSGQSLRGLWALSLAAAALDAVGVITIVPLAEALLGVSPALSKWCFILGALVVLRAVALLAHARLSARASAAAMHETKLAVLKAYCASPDAAFLDARRGKVAQRVSRSSHSAGTIVLRLPQLASESVRAAALTGLMLWMDVRVAGAILVAGAALWTLFSRLLSPKAYAFARDRSSAEAEQNALLAEIVQGTRQIRLAGALDPWLERFRDASLSFSRRHADDMALQALPRIWFEAGAALVVLGWMLAAAWRHASYADFRLPVLAAIGAGSAKLLPCLASVARCRLEILASLPDAESLEAFLKAHPPAANPGVRPFEGLRSGLRLEGVSFSYPGRGQVLGGVDLDIPAGSRAVLVGPYGSGKTTILSLLLGSNAPSAGRVLVDGAPLSEYDLRTWWRQVGVVSQDAFLVHGTVEQNITLGREGFSRAAVESAAASVGAQDFIASLPQGYDTVVGESGMKLSGGQRQQLILARALLGDPKVLVLDEPATGLDAEAQARFASLLREVSAGRTVVVAAHGPEWAAWADACFTLEDGRLKQPA